MIGPLYSVFIQFCYEFAEVWCFFGDGFVGSVADVHVAESGMIFLEQAVGLSCGCGVAEIQRYTHSAVVVNNSKDLLDLRGVFAVAARCIGKIFEGEFKVQSSA